MSMCAFKSKVEMIKSCTLFRIPFKCVIPSSISRELLSCFRKINWPACVWRILFGHSWAGTKTEPWYVKCLSFPEWFHPTFFGTDPLVHNTKALSDTLTPVSLSKKLRPDTYELGLVFVDGQWRVVHGGSHRALLAKFPFLLFAQGVDFFTAHNVFGMEWHFSWLQFLCNLCRYGVLMRLVICVNTNKSVRCYMIYFFQVFFLLYSEVNIIYMNYKHGEIYIGKFARG